MFGFLRGQFIDVIHWVDDSRDTMVWRFERHGHAINYGAKLTVREGQAAVFIHEGQLADVFAPGLFLLETNNLPVLTALQHWDHGFSSPFKSEVYFLNTRRFTGLKWGTRNPVMLRDPEFGPLRLRAFGTYAMRITEPARFMSEIVGTDGNFTTDEVSGQIRNIIVAKVAVVLAQSGIAALDMAANKTELGRIVAERLAPMMVEYGLEIPEFYIENISLPPEVEKVLDQRTSMGIVGDLGRYSQFAAAQAMQSAAANPGEGGAGLGAGLGMGMGMAMARQAATSQPGAAEPPPPPPAGQVWHIAEGGSTTGPFSLADLGRMAAEGRFRRDSLVWTQGQDAWAAAGSIPELARLFAAVPPPPPPPPPPAAG